MKNEITLNIGLFAFYQGFENFDAVNKTILSVISNLVSYSITNLGVINGEYLNENGNKVVERTLVVNLRNNLYKDTIEKSLALAESEILDKYLQNICIERGQIAIAVSAFNELNKLVYNPKYIGNKNEFDYSYFLNI